MGVYYPQGIMTMRVILENFGDEANEKLKTNYVFNVICRTLKVNKNDYKEADTFSVEIDFKSFPFDPRAVRSVGVTIHIEDREKLFKRNNALNKIGPTEESVLFQGFADTDKISMDSEKRTVTLEGRDFTSLLIDKEYLGNPVELSKPVDQVLRDLLDQVEETKLDPADSTRGIKINNLTGETLPTLAGLGISLFKKEGKRNARPKRTYWDMIQKIVSDAALIAYIDLDELVINRPRTLFSKDKKKLFVYGENLNSLTFERKIGRQKGFNIKVLSLNTLEKKVETVLIPEEATAAWASDIGIKRERIKIPALRSDGSQAPDKDAPFIVFRLKKIKDKDHLITAGEKIYEEVGRQQLEGTLSTKEMRVCEVDKRGRRSTIFNVLDFRVGTPIEIDINQGDLRGMPSLQTGNKKIRKNRIVKFLLQNCYDSVIADALAESLVNFDTPFFTKAFSFSLDQDSGFSFDIDFINFIEIPQNIADRG